MYCTVCAAHNLSEAPIISLQVSKSTFDIVKGAENVWLCSILKHEAPG